MVKERVATTTAYTDAGELGKITSPRACKLSEFQVRSITVVFRELFTQATSCGQQVVLWLSKNISSLNKRMKTGREHTM